MATQKQIDANRRNARKSTGPRTEAGKAASSGNALKTGIDARSQVIRGEDPKALQFLTAEYHDRYRPSTPEQRALVDTLISSDWLQRRLRLVEAHLWEHAFERMDNWDSDTDAPLGEAFASNNQAFARLQRRIDSVDRNYHRALKELRRLQHPATGQPPNERSEPAGPPRIAGEIGFVSQASPVAPAPARPAARANILATPIDDGSRL